jgi:hypothetical protein
VREEGAHHWVGQQDRGLEERLGARRGEERADDRPARTLARERDAARRAAEAGEDLVQEAERGGDVLRPEVRVPVRREEAELRTVSTRARPGEKERTPPSRYCATATIERVAAASCAASSPGSLAEPSTNEPPWIQRSVGASFGSPCGTYRSSARQSSAYAPASRLSCGHACGVPPGCFMPLLRRVSACHEEQRGGNLREAPQQRGDRGQPARGDAVAHHESRRGIIGRTGSNPERREHRRRRAARRRRGQDEHGERERREQAGEHGLEEGGRGSARRDCFTCAGLRGRRR